MRRLALSVLLVFASMAWGEDSFLKLVGNVRVAPVQDSDQIILPFITWGGDAATFYGNGGLETQQGSIFAKHGLNFKLVPGDDVIQQARNYLEGKTPFLRCTFRMAGMLSEVLGNNPETQGVVILQMTWSAGDHIVAREGIKTLADMEDTKGTAQMGGPHVGLIDDALKTPQLTWDDVTMQWAADLTASKDSPAEIFRNNPDIQWAAVISPDMTGLTGGLQSIGSGAEGTVKGAHVLVSTAQLSRSIADIYIVRKDWYNAHKDTVHKFVAAYLESCERVAALQKDYESKGSDEYTELLKLVQKIYGEEVIPTIEEDAHGLIADCTFVMHAGNVAFFTDEKNLSGFNAFHESALTLATSRGYASTRKELIPAALDYARIASLGSLKFAATVGNVQRTAKFKAEAVRTEIEGFNEEELDKNTIYSFTINFEANQMAFPISQYKAEFERLAEFSSKYGNAVIVVRGHTDPSKTLIEFVRAGLKKGTLKRSGSRGSYVYSLEGRPLDLNNTDQVVQLIKSGAFDGVRGHNPREIMTAAQNLSLHRANALKASILQFAERTGIFIDPSQINPVGVGVSEPFIAKPRNFDEAGQNRRVEFRLVSVNPETMTDSDFDF